MSLDIHRVQVWSAEIPDRPGAAAAKLEQLAHAGADLEFVFMRPHPTRPDHGILFLAPIRGPEQTQVAREAGLAPALDVAMLRVEGDNRPGVGADLMSALAVAGINLRGLSISAVSGRYAACLAFDDADAATQALRVLAAVEA
ncbi:MAG: hypothetical protein L0Z62_31515 [Gemmataceae bacterium]|nr:hypothetical protein [Gemmataceae bacterium]